MPTLGKRSLGVLSRFYFLFVCSYLPIKSSCVSPLLFLSYFFFFGSSVVALNSMTVVSDTRIGSLCIIESRMKLSGEHLLNDSFVIRFSPRRNFVCNKVWLLLCYSLFDISILSFP